MGAMNSAGVLQGDGRQRAGGRHQLRRRAHNSLAREPAGLPKRCAVLPFSAEDRRLGAEQLNQLAHLVGGGKASESVSNEQTIAVPSSGLHYTGSSAVRLPLPRLAGAKGRPPSPTHKHTARDPPSCARGSRVGS